MRRLLSPIAAGIAVLVLALYFANIFDLYGQIPHFDKILHLSGGFLVAWFFGIFFETPLRKVRPMERVFLLLGTAALIGVLWEFLEFLSNQYADTFPIFHYFLYGGDLADTIGDLAFDLTGAILFALPLSLRRKQ